MACAETKYHFHLHFHFHYFRAKTSDSIEGSIGDCENQQTYIHNCFETYFAQRS